MIALCFLHSMAYVISYDAQFLQMLKCYYDQNLTSSLLQKRFLFSLSEVAVPVWVIEVNFGAL